jgi:ribosomal 50S subunit-recycling heat shock protein
MAQSGRIRLTRDGGSARLDKASRLVRIGDELIFAFAGRLTAVRILALGCRRGPPAEARGLYAALPSPDEVPGDRRGVGRRDDLGARLDAAPLTILAPASERRALT